MSDAPNRIWITGNATSGSWNSTPVSTKRIDMSEAQYIRADLAETIVRAALEAATEVIKQDARNGLGSHAAALWLSNAIRSLASDPAQVAAILKKAGDGNKEQRDEEDRV